VRKSRALTGLPVVVNGRRIGRVVQTELSEDLSELAGIWIATGFLGTRFIPGDSVGLIGEVSIIADHSGIRRRCRPAAIFRRAVGSDGSRVGAIIGAEIDEISLRVEALELSCGLWDDLVFGRKCIRRFTLNQETGNVVVDISEIEKEANRQ